MRSCRTLVLALALLLAACSGQTTRLRATGIYEPHNTVFIEAPGSESSDGAVPGSEASSGSEGGGDVPCGKKMTWCSKEGYVCRDAEKAEEVQAAVKEAEVEEVSLQHPSALVSTPQPGVPTRHCCFFASHNRASCFTRTICLPTRTMLCLTRAERTWSQTRSLARSALA